MNGEICIVNTIWWKITIQGAYCYLDTGYDTAMYENAGRSRKYMA